MTAQSAGDDPRPAVVVRTEDAVRHVTLNRPDRLNAISLDLLEQLVDALADADADPQARAVLLTASGRAFCAGGDLQALAADDRFVTDGLVLARRLVLTAAALSKPLVTAVNGAAVGGGASIALLGDVVFVGESGFLQFAYSRIGLVPDFGGLFLLPALVGTLRAKDLLLTNRRVGAAEAVAMGLASRATADADLATEAAATARELAAGPTLALGRIRQYLSGVTVDDGVVTRSPALEQCLDFEGRQVPALAASADHAEAVAALLEQRRPRFRGA